MDLREEFDNIHEKLDTILKGTNDKAPEKKKTKVVEEVDDVDEEEAVPAKKTKAAKEEDDDTDEEEETTPAKKSKSKGPTLAQVKLKLKEVLDKKGRPAAVQLLDAYNAEKVGDLEEEQYADFIFAAQKVLDKGPSKKKEADLDLDEDDDTE